MYESYGTYVNAEYVDNHDYVGDTDDGTDDDTDDDTGDDTDDDTDDDNDHKKDSYTAAGVAPDAGAAPGSWPFYGGGFGRGKYCICPESGSLDWEEEEEEEGGG